MHQVTTTNKNIPLRFFPPTLRTPKKIVIEVAGIDGTKGFMTVTTPRSFIPAPSDISIYLNSQPIDFNFTQEASYNVAKLSYNHSTQEIAIKLPFWEGEMPKRFYINLTPPAPKTFPYQWILVVVVISMVTVALLVVFKRRQRLK